MKHPRDGLREIASLYRGLIYGGLSHRERQMIRLLALYGACTIEHNTVCVKEKESAVDAYAAKYPTCERFDKKESAS